MRHRSRALPERLKQRRATHRRALAIVMPGLVLALSGAAPKGSEVTVMVTDIRSDKGVVRACMTRDPGSFPRCRGVEGSYGATVSAGSGATITFHDVKPGRYAIALLHDENGNGKADRAAMMIPTEGFGFSRDAKVRMGPPKFGEAAFEVTGGDERMSIRMRYLL